MMPEFFGTPFSCAPEASETHLTLGALLWRGQVAFIAALLDATYGYGNRLRVRQNWIRMSASAV